MKRVLFLAYLFPPILSSGTYRPLKFAKYLSDYGWATTVLTAANFHGYPTDAALLAEVPSNVRVVRVPMLNERIEGWFRAALGNAIGGRLGHAIRWRLQKRFGTPDMYALWKPEVTRAALRIFREDGFDAIYATGFPWTSLVAGREIARLTNRPLIADFRDPWYAEREVIEQAHTVTTVADGVGRRLSAAHPDVDGSKFCAIHNGFDAADLSTRPPRPPGQPFRIVDTGVWKTGSYPSVLYDCIDWLKRAQPQVLEGVEVVVAGFAPGEARRRGLDSIITELGVVSHANAVALMQTADVLFVAHADPQRQWAVPGKLYEYLASGTPVLALTYRDNECDRIIRAVGGAVVVEPEDPGTLYNALADICRRKRFEVPPVNQQALGQFERRHLTAKLAALLDDACYTTRSREFSTKAKNSSGAATLFGTKADSIRPLRP